MRRKTHDNKIVIVCEGTDTEPNYFNALVKYMHTNHKYDDFKIKNIPIKEDELKREEENKHKGKRQLHDGNVNKYVYYAETDTEENYKHYKPQPLRYVREAQLFVERNGYHEGWAVFDKDHIESEFAEEAFKMSNEVNNLHIAFSSYCIEEWFLSHFEYNTKAFEHSECKKDDGTYKGCNATVGCKGQDCLIGYMRAKEYILDYDKAADKVFDNYTLPMIRQEPIMPFLNSARLRITDKTHEKIYERNPYCDVDFLVARLLGLPCYKYIDTNYDNELKINGTQLLFEKVDAMMEIKNDGKIPFVIQSQKFKLLKSDNGKYKIYSDVQRTVLKPKKMLSVDLSSHDDMLMIKPDENHVIIVG